MPSTSHEHAMRDAQRAIDALGHALAEHEVLTIQCRHNHHLGAVYATSAGPVVRTQLGPRSRGRRDFYAGTHGDAERGRYVDLLEPASDLVDAVPAWCACGTWTLAREELRAALRARLRTLRVPVENEE